MLIFFGLHGARHWVRLIGMKLRFRFLAARFALTALVLFQVEGLWASSTCSMEMPAATQVTDAAFPADDCAMGQPGHSHEHDGQDSKGPDCPLMPAGAASCVGAAVLLPSSAAPSLGTAEDELPTASSDHAKDLLLAVFLLRPPIA